MRNVTQTDLPASSPKGARSVNTKVLTPATPSSFSAQLQIAKTQAHNALQQHPAAPRKDPGSTAGTTTSGTPAQSVPTTSTNAPPTLIQASGIMPVNTQPIDTGNTASAGSSRRRLRTFSQPQNDVAKATAGTKLSSSITAPSESGQHSAMSHGTVAKLYPQGARMPLPQSVQQSLIAAPTARPVGSQLPQNIRHGHPAITPHHAAIQIADNNPGGSVLLHQGAQHAPGGVVISSYTAKNNHNINMHIRQPVENRNKPTAEITNNAAALMPGVAVSHPVDQKSHTTATKALNGLTASATGEANLPPAGGDIAPVGVTNPPVATANSSAIQQGPWNQLAPTNLTQPDWQHVIAKRIRQTPLGSTVQIQVHPHHLGPISMQVSNATNGVISVWLQASNPQTQALLQQALPQISQSLSSLGSNASVVVNTNAFGAFGSGAQGHTPNHGHTGGSSSHPSPMVPENSASSALDSVTSIATGFESWI